MAGIYRHPQFRGLKRRIVVIVSSGTSLIQGSASINIENFGIKWVGTFAIGGGLS